MIHPRLQSERLRLRAFVAEDAPAVAELAGARAIADTMIALPHPLTPAVARCEIAAYASGYRSGRSIHFAVEAERELVGCVGLAEIDPEHLQAELTFWIGEAHQGRGYAGEAVAATVTFGFDALELNRIYARQLLRNPAAGRVVEKCGMRREGVLRQHVRRWKAFEDVALWAMLRSDPRISPMPADPRLAPGTGPEAR